MATVSGEEDAMSSIRRLGGDASRRMCVGQVVASLAAAAKELIENALDAHASSVPEYVPNALLKSSPIIPVIVQSGELYFREVTVKDQGFESLEVSDNGTGVRESDFQALGKLHQTSKITAFEDLTSIESFGFRGEALSALCSMAMVIILTRHKDDVMASKLSFDHNGNIVEQTKCTRLPGTTVTVRELFCTLPVRRKELKKNLRREWGKLVSTVEAFAVGRVGASLTLATVVADKRQAIVSTHGHRTLRENICTVFGAKQMDALVALDTPPTPLDADVLGQFALTPADFEHVDIRVTGYVSTCEHGKGRSNTDRQFIFVNGRPCDIPKVSKTINELYHSFNKTQYPVFVLLVSVAKDTVDVNVTPDKRSVLLTHERHLLAVLRSALVAVFANQAARTPTVAPGAHVAALVERPPPITLNSGTRLPKAAATTTLKRSQQTTSTSTLEDAKQPRLEQFRFISNSLRDGGNELSDGGNGRLTPGDRRVGGVSADLFRLPPGVDDVDIGRSPNGTIGDSLPVSSNNRSKDDDLSLNNAIPARVTSPLGESTTCQQQVNSGLQNGAGKDGQPDVEPVSTITAPATDNSPIHASVVIDESPPETRPRREVECSMDVMQTMLDDLVTVSPAEDDERCGLQAFGANEGAPKVIEEELTRRLSKSDFKQMEILGQFNLGFIIARLRDDLYILDQHACDEKHTFETLQRKATVDCQRLFRPKKLELGAVGESVLMGSLDIFQKNGFAFKIDENAEPGQKVQLDAVPTLHNCDFNSDDVEEMIAVLAEFPGMMYRPTKLRRIFASRACRKSVMIGTALTSAQMTRIVDQLSKLDHPWNCPHGRPTLRHLTSLTKNKSDPN